MSMDDVSGLMKLHPKELCEAAWPLLSDAERNRPFVNVPHLALPELQLRTAARVEEQSRVICAMDDAFQADAIDLDEFTLRQRLVAKVIASGVPSTDMEPQPAPQCAPMNRKKKQSGGGQRGGRAKGAATQQHHHIDPQPVESIFAAAGTAAAIQACRAMARPDIDQLLRGFVLSDEVDSLERCDAFIRVLSASVMLDQRGVDTLVSIVVDVVKSPKVRPHVLLPLLHLACAVTTLDMLTPTTCDLLAESLADFRGVFTHPSPPTACAVEFSETRVIDATAEDASWSTCIPLRYASRCRLHVTQCSKSAPVLLLASDGATPVARALTVADDVVDVDLARPTLMLRVDPTSEAKSCNFRAVLTVDVSTEVFCGVEHEVTLAVAALQLAVAKKLFGRRPTALLGDVMPAKSFLTLHRNGLRPGAAAANPASVELAERMLWSADSDHMQKLLKCRRGALNSARLLLGLSVLHTGVTSEQSETFNELVSFVRVHSDTISTAFGESLALDDAIREYIRCVVPYHVANPLTADTSVVNICDNVAKLCQLAAPSFSAVESVLNDRRAVAAAMIAATKLVNCSLRHLGVKRGFVALRTFRSFLRDVPIPDLVAGAGPLAETDLRSSVATVVETMMKMLRVLSRLTGRAAAHRVVRDALEGGLFALSALAVLASPLDTTLVETSLASGLDDLFAMLPAITDFTRSSSFEINAADEDEAASVWSSMAELEQVANLAHENRFPAERDGERRRLSLCGRGEVVAENPLPTVSSNGDASAMAYCELRICKLDSDTPLVAGLLGTPRALDVALLHQERLITVSSTGEIGGPLVGATPLDLNFPLRIGDTVGIASVSTLKDRGLIRMLAIFINDVMIVSVKAPPSSDIALVPFVDGSGSPHEVDWSFGPRFVGTPSRHHPAAHPFPTMQLIWAAASATLHVLVSRADGAAATPSSVQFQRRCLDALATRVSFIADTIFEHHHANATGAVDDPGWGATERVKWAAAKRMHLRMLLVHLCTIDQLPASATGCAASIADLTRALMAIARASEAFPPYIRFIALQVLRRKLGDCGSPEPLEHGNLRDLLLPLAPSSGDGTLKSPSEATERLAFDPDRKSSHLTVDGDCVYSPVRHDRRSAALGASPVAANGGSVSVVINRTDGPSDSLGRLYFVGLATRSAIAKDPSVLSNYLQSKFLKSDSGVYVIADFIEASTRSQMINEAQLSAHTKNWHNQGKHVVFTGGDIITIRRAAASGIEFYRNGMPLGTLFENISDSDELFPYVALYNSDASATLLATGCPDLTPAAHAGMIRAMLANATLGASVASHLVELLRSGELSPTTFLQYLGSDGDETAFNIGSREGGRVISLKPDNTTVEFEGRRGSRVSHPLWMLTRNFGAPAQLSNVSDDLFDAALGILEGGFAPTDSSSSSAVKVSDVALFLRSLRVVTKLASTAPRREARDKRLIAIATKLLQSAPTRRSGPSRGGGGRGAEEEVLHAAWRYFLPDASCELADDAASPRSAPAAVSFDALLSPAVALRNPFGARVEAAATTWNVVGGSGELELRVAGNGGVTGSGVDSRGSFAVRGTIEGGCTLDLNLVYDSRVASPTSPDSPPPSDAEDTWACAACTFINPRANSRCEICNTPNPGRTWSCPQCTYAFNTSGDPCCSICGFRKAAEDAAGGGAAAKGKVARCDACGNSRPVGDFLNFSASAECSKCGKSTRWRPADVFILRLEASLQEGGDEICGSLNYGRDSRPFTARLKGSSALPPLSTATTFVTPSAAALTGDAVTLITASPLSSRVARATVAPAAVLEAIKLLVSTLFCDAFPAVHTAVDSNEVAVLVTKLECSKSEIGRCVALLPAASLRRSVVACLERGPQVLALRVADAISGHLLATADSEETKSVAAGLFTAACALALRSTADHLRNEFTRVACELLENFGAAVPVQAAVKLLSCGGRYAERLRVVCALHGTRRVHEDVALNCMILILQVVRRMDACAPLPLLMDSLSADSFPHWVAIGETRMDDNNRLIVGQLRGSRPLTQSSGGCYYFEMTVPPGGRTSAVIGWGTRGHEREGDMHHVGSDVHSFGLDLRASVRMLGGTRPYPLGAPLNADDVVGALLDLDARKACFSVNGEQYEWFELPLAETEPIYPFVSASTEGNGADVRLRSTRFCPPGFVDFGPTVDLHAVDEPSPQQPQSRLFYAALCSCIDELETAGITIGTIAGASSEWEAAAARSAAALAPIEAFLKTQPPSALKPYVRHLSSLSELSVVGAGKTECLRNSSLWPEFIKAKGMLLLSARWAAFAKVLARRIERPSSKATVELDRNRAKERAATPAHFVQHSVFGQLHAHTARQRLFLRNPMFSVKFTGDISEDNGGLYRTAMSIIAEELVTHPGSIMKRSGHTLFNTVVPDPSRRSDEDLRMFTWLGSVMGNAVVTGAFVLAIDLPRLVWKRLVKEDVTIEEYYFDIDNTVRGSLEMDEFLLDDEYFAELVAATGAAAPSLPSDRSPSEVAAQRRQFACAALLHQFDTQIAAIAKGLADVVPESVLVEMRWADLQRRVCGVSTVSFEDMLSVLDLSAIAEPVRRTFEEALQIMSSAARSKLLLFCTGQPRLPVPERVKVICGDDPHLFPTAHTCSPITVTIQAYSSAAQMCEKLQVASAHAHEFGFV